MTSHIVGAVCALVMIVLALQTSIRSHSALSVVCAALYTTCVLITFVVSSVYHGLPKGKGKQVMRVIDHCDIFFTIAGTYTPIALLSIRSVNPTMGWVIFGIEWALALLGATLNAIDLKKYSKFSMACYLGMGWCVVISLRDAITGMTMNGFLWLLWGGLAFTIGAVLYLIGFSLNMLTLFALVLVIGTVVDDAIVVVEAVQAQFDAGCRSSYDATVNAMHGITSRGSRPHPAQPGGLLVAAHQQDLLHLRHHLPHLADQCGRRDCIEQGFPPRVANGARGVGQNRRGF